MAETSPTEFEKVRAALTKAQIDVAVRMRHDPENWKLIFTGVGKRMLYVRKPAGDPHV